MNARPRRRRPSVRVGDRIPTAVRSILQLMVGTVGAQVVNILAVPVLARLFGPESVGVYAYTIAIVLIASSVAALRMEWAIPLPAEEKDARAVTQVALVLVTLISILGLGILVAFRSQVQSASPSVPIYPYIYWAPLLVALTSWFNVLTQASLRARRYTIVGRITLLQGVVLVAVQILSSAVTRTPNGLFAGHAAGRASGLVSLVRTNRSLLFPRERHLTRALKTYWRFPVVFAPSSLLNTLGSNLPLIILGSTFGASVAGNFSMAQRIALIPSTIVGTAVGQVFLSEMSARLRQGLDDNRAIYLTATKRLLLVAAPITVGLALLSGWLFVVVLGDQWALAGEFAQLISVSVGLGFVASPLSFVFVAYQRTRESVLVDVSRIILVVASGVAAARAGYGAHVVVGVMYAGQVVNYAITWLVGLRIVSGPLRQPGSGSSTPARDGAGST